MASANRPDDRSLFNALLRSPVVWALAALWLLLFAMEKARPCFFLHDDNADWFIGAYLHDFRVLAETGRLAEVNYYQHGGEPFVEQGQTAVLYPPVYLGVLFAQVFSGDARWSLEWIAAIDLSIGLLGFHCWLRQGGIAPWQAALGALAWVLNPFALIIGESWIFVTFVVAWLPWIFWSLDRLLATPSASAAFLLGASTSLLLLQGYVQYFAYAILFLILYALFQFATRREARRLVVLYYLVVSVLIFAIFCLPLLLPMNDVVGVSAMRSYPMPVDAALYYHASPGTILYAQILHFDRWLAFGASAAAIYCPALLLAPVVILRLFYADAPTRNRLIVLLILSLLALIFTTNGHWLLSQLPIFNRFRWPFKVFLFADFFLISALAWSASSWTKPPASRPRWGSIAAGLCLVVAVLANLDISLAYHDEDRLSQTDLPATINPLVPGMELRLGRVATFADYDLQNAADYYYTRAYATYFSFPSIGGYNPLVRGDILEYALYLDYPNVCSDKITPEFQKRLEARSVRYWMVDPQSSHFAEAKSLPGLRILQAKDDRVVFEDPQAVPLVYVVGDPSDPCAMTYSGNSILIPLRGLTSPVSVSVAPTDGWWYRVGHGPWLKPVDRDNRLIIPFTTLNPRLPDQPNSQMEVTYFDPRFWLALRWSAALLLPLGLLLIAGRRIWN